LISDARSGELAGAAGAVREMLELIGLEALAEPDEEAAPAEAEELLAERADARAAKDWARADEIRDRLAELGWEVRDEAGGARLVRRG
jgi:cysteinyl-tRNA synthetase